MTYINAFGYSVQVSAFNWPTPFFQFQVNRKHGYLWAKLGTLEISVFRNIPVDREGWNTVH